MKYRKFGNDRERFGNKNEKSAFIKLDHPQTLKCFASCTHYIRYLSRLWSVKLG